MTYCIFHFYIICLFIVTIDINCNYEVSKTAPSQWEAYIFLGSKYISLTFSWLFMENPTQTLGRLFVFGVIKDEGGLSREMHVSQSVFSCSRLLLFLTFTIIQNLKVVQRCFQTIIFRMGLGNHIKGPFQNAFAA